MAVVVVLYGSFGDAGACCSGFFVVVVVVLIVSEVVVFAIIMSVVTWCINHRMISICRSLIFLSEYCTQR